MEKVLFFFLPSPHPTIPVQQNISNTFNEYLFFPSEHLIWYTTRLCSDVWIWPHPYPPALALPQPPKDSIFFNEYSKTCVREPPSRLTLNSGWCGKSCLSYKGKCHVILLAKLHDMYLYKTTTFPHQPLKSISKVAVLHRFYCTCFTLTTIQFDTLVDHFRKAYFDRHPLWPAESLDTYGSTIYCINPKYWVDNPTKPEQKL